MTGAGEEKTREDKTSAAAAVPIPSLEIPATNPADEYVDHHKVFRHNNCGDPLSHKKSDVLHRARVLAADVKEGEGNY